MRHIRKYKLDILNYIYFHTHRKRWLNERRAVEYCNKHNITWDFGKYY